MPSKELLTLFTDARTCARHLDTMLDVVGPFARLADVVDALPQRQLDDWPLPDAMPGAWPTVGDLRKLRDAATAAGWRNT